MLARIESHGLFFFIPTFVSRYIEFVSRRTGRIFILRRHFCFTLFIKSLVSSSLIVAAPLTNSNRLVRLPVRSDLFDADVRGVIVETRPNYGCFLKEDDEN